MITPGAGARIAARLSPVRPWMARIDRRSLRADAVAGLTNAAIVLPQGVAFAIIAGLPPVYGLYTAMITPVVAAIWGSSTVMVSGPTTAISALLFAALSEIAPAGTPIYVELALAVTVLVGLFQLAAGLARLGGLVSFVSHSVITGFTAAAAFLIAAAQLAPAMGVEVVRGGSVLERVERAWAAAPEANPLAAALAVGTLVGIIVVQRFAPRAPVYLIALAGACVAAWAADAPGAGVAMVGALPSVVPSFHLPAPPLQLLPELATAAAAIAVVGLLEAVSISRAFGLRRREKVDTNQEMIGQGLSNAVGGMFQAYAGSGSFTRSGLNAESGARTPMAAILAAAFLFLILLLVAPLVAWIPIPAMAGAILHVAWRLIDRVEIRHVLRTSRQESLILGVTFLTGAVVGLDAAIVAGVIASLSVFLHDIAHPMLAVGTPAVIDGKRRFASADLPGLPSCPQIANVRLEGTLFFASIEHVEREIEAIDRRHPGRLIRILHLKGIGQLDLAGADFLIGRIREMRARGGDYFIIAVFPPVVSRLNRLGVLAALGKDKLCIGKADAVAKAVAAAKDDICARCTARVFQECALKPGPEGTPGFVEAPEAADAVRARSSSGSRLGPHDGVSRPV